MRSWDNEKMRYRDRAAKYMLNVQAFVASAFFIMLVVGIVPSYSETVGVSTGQPAMPEADNKSRELPFGTETTEEETIFLMSLDELLEMEIVTASRIPEQLAKTISSVSVITDVDLSMMGARTIYDALRTIPGISVDYNSSNFPVIEIRGVRKNSSDNILFLLNGHSINGLMSSSALTIGAIDLPLANIKCIEVIRGPGSAIYGTNAVIGVINIITKGPDDIDGIEFSFDKEFEDEGSIGQKFNALIGKRFKNDIGFTLNLGLFDYDGAEQFIEADSLGRSGFADTEHDAYDIQGSLEIGKITLAGRYHNQNRGAFLSKTSTISPGSEENSEHAFLNARTVFDLTDKLDLTVNGYYDYREADFYHEFYPAGSIPPPHSLSVWNESGYITDLKWKATKSGGDIMMTYRGIEAQTFVTGIAVEYQRTYDVKHFANHNPGFLPSVQDVSDGYNWNRNEDRLILAGYAEDRWDVRDDLRLSLGIRYDYYNDIDDSFNPRIGLMWNITGEYKMKLLYGEAFRAPDFGDMYIENVGPISGNPDLAPEKIKTFEAGLEARFIRRMNTSVTYFHSELDDLITFDPGALKAGNFGSTTVDGIELEARYELDKGSFISVNYTYTDSIKNDEERFPDIPMHKGNVSMNWLIIKQVNFYTNTYWQSDSPRASGDSRDSMSGYVVVNTTLMAYNFRKYLDLRFSIYNLFGRNYTYPASPSIPGDIPAPGRSFILGVSLSF